MKHAAQEKAASNRCDNSELYLIYSTWYGASPPLKHYAHPLAHPHAHLHAFT